MILLFLEFLMVQLALACQFLHSFLLDLVFLEVPLFRIHLLPQAHLLSPLHPLDLAILVDLVLQDLQMVPIVLGYPWDLANLSCLLYQGVQAYQEVQQSLGYLEVQVGLYRPSFLLLLVHQQVLGTQGLQDFLLLLADQLDLLYLEFLFHLAFQGDLEVPVDLDFLFLPLVLLYLVHHVFLAVQPNLEVLCVLVSL